MPSISKIATPPNGSKLRRAMLYLAVFGLTGAVVYRWGKDASRPTPPSASHSATARVVLGEGVPEPADADAIVRRIASKENVRRAAVLARLATVSDADVRETIAHRLTIRGDDASTADGWAVSITSQGTFAEHPDRLVNALADSFANAYRAEWKQARHEAHAAAQEATSRAEREFLDAKAELEAFDREQPETRFPMPGEPADTALGEPIAAAAVQTPAQETTEAEAFEPVMVENPEWTELDRQLTSLRERLSQLLVDRTRLHPEVQNTELRIEATERQLALVPREILGEPIARLPLEDSAPVAEPSVRVAAPVGPTAEEIERHRNEQSREFVALKAATDRAADAYLEAFGRQREAWQAQQAEPQVQVAPAEPIAAPAALAAAASPWTPVFGGLGGGLAMVLGLGMISAGAAIQPPVNSVDRVGRLLPAPVVGVLPETRPSSGGRRFWARWQRVLAGLTLIGGFATVLVRAWGI